MVFLSGCLWVLVGGLVLELADPLGIHDEIVTGKDPSIVRTWAALIAWPLTLLAMSLR